MLFSNVGKMNKMIGYDRYYDGGDCPDPCEDCECESRDEAEGDCECGCHTNWDNYFVEP